ncbi:MAG: hypothetical protein IT569_04755, partial [Leptospiraceae bacterium]|nr:hypothetical protein [Leptospiraceae bacterium]
KINLGLHQANSQKNGFVLTGFEYYLDSYKKTVQEIPAKIDTFKTTNSTDGNGSKNSLTSLEFIVEQNIYGMDSVLKNREASGLEGLKYTAYLGKESGTFKEFESKKVIFKKAEKNTIQEKMIILTRWNILFFAASILSIALILAELFLIYMIRRKWKSIQAI